MYPVVVVVVVGVADLEMSDYIPQSSSNLKDLLISQHKEALCRPFKNLFKDFLNIISHH